jgi:hypothetical protein
MKSSFGTVPRPYFNNGHVATQCRLCNVLLLFGYQHPGDVPPTGVSVLRTTITGGRRASG